MALELRNTTTNALDFSRVTDVVISALDPTSQKALLDLMKSAERKDAAVVRRAVATRRVHEAIDNEERLRIIHEDASSEIPFQPIVAKLEAELNRPLTASEMQAAREQHATRVRGLREAEARKAAIAAYTASH